MSDSGPRDEEQQELERAVAEDGGAGERLRLAEFFERAGRFEEALGVLLPSLNDGEVARAVARFPAWSHVRGDAGRTCFVDAPPPVAAPRLTWQGA